jgi:hypothetical protein
MLLKTSLEAKQRPPQPLAMSIKAETRAVVQRQANVCVRVTVERDINVNPSWGQLSYLCFSVTRKYLVGN